MHTPGPWTFDGENPENQGYDIALPDGGTLATAYYDVDRDEFSARQAEANARLIAAAPALLAACKELLAAAEQLLAEADKKTNAGSATAACAVMFRARVRPAIALAENSADRS